MNAVLTWMKDFLVIYLVLTILTSLAAIEQYKKYLHFFSGVVLLLVLTAPVLNWFGGDGRLEALVSYEAFWEELDSARQDMKKLEFLENDRFISKYEQAVAQDILMQAAQLDISVRQVTVNLSSDYEIRQAVIRLDSLSDSDFAAAEEKLRAFLKETYGLKAGQVQIS